MPATPTPVERAHYGKLIGWRITAIRWLEIEGQPLPVLVLGHKNSTIEAAVLCDPEGNGPGHLEHHL